MSESFKRRTFHRLCVVSREQSFITEVYSTLVRRLSSLTILVTEGKASRKPYDMEQNRCKKMNILKLSKRPAPRSQNI